MFNWEIKPYVAFDPEDRDAAVLREVRDTADRAICRLKPGDKITIERASENSGAMYKFHVTYE